MTTPASTPTSTTGSGIDFACTPFADVPLVGETSAIARLTTGDLAAHAFERGVELRDVAVVVLAVVNLHRLRIDVRRQGVVSVGQVGKLVIGHLFLSSKCRRRGTLYALVGGLGRNR